MLFAEGYYLDAIPIEVFNIIFAMAIEGDITFAPEEYCKNATTDSITVNMTVLPTSLMLNTRSRNAALPFQLMIKDNVKNSVTRLNTNRATMASHKMPRLAPGSHQRVKNLEIEAHLLPYFQRNSTQPDHIATMPANLMFAKIESMSALLHRNRRLFQPIERARVGVSTWRCQEDARWDEGRYGGHRLRV